MGKHIHIYSISPNYTRCQVFTGDRVTRERLGTSTITLIKGLTRQRRYDEIAKWLQERFDIALPAYQPTTQRGNRSLK